MSANPSFLTFLAGQVRRFSSEGRLRTAETYKATYRSFSLFLNGEDPSFAQITTSLMEEYERWLLSRHLSRNTTSFYMRILRASYNKGVGRGYARQKDPFRLVYTGVAPTQARAISLQNIRRLKALDLSGEPALAVSRDLFLFSFYTRGMSFIDMAYLRKCDLDGNVLRYRRQKTGQLLSIRWEPCMQEILDRLPPASGEWLLPIIRAARQDPRKQYITAIYRVNTHLHILSRRLGLPVSITTYVARHTWASIAYRRNVPLSVISEGMGHGSERTTRIYLASLGNARIDQANRRILKLI